MGWKHCRGDLLRRGPVPSCPCWWIRCCCPCPCCPRCPRCSRGSRCPRCSRPRCPCCCPPSCSPRSHRTSFWISCRQRTVDELLIKYLTIYLSETGYVLQ